tara:strand:+ start:1547 stop:1924 length:378 start_codon:yes stop_codon:yes gene_type:complete
MENQKITIPLKKDIKVYHSLTCDANDVTITRFVDWIDNIWVQQWTPLLNIKMMKFDIGHNILHFQTLSKKDDLIKYMLEISKTFPKMFIMYDFYTINETKHHQGTYFLLNGQITDDNFIIEKEGV